MKKLLCAVALVGMLAVPGAAQAQVTLGPLAAFHNDADFGIGAYASIPVPSLNENLSIAPSFVYFFPEGYDYWELNGDVIYRFEVSEDTPVLPFAMAGLNIANASAGDVSDTQVGLNLGGGITFRADSFRPFVGAKFEIEGGDDFVVFGGLGFPVGG